MKIDTQMGTVTIIMDIINRGENSRIVTERSMTMSIEVLNIICSVCNGT